MDLSFDITNTEGDKIKVALSYYDAETVNALLPDPFVLTLEFYDVTLVREAGCKYVGYKMLSAVSGILAKFLAENEDAVLCFYCDSATDVGRRHLGISSQEYRSNLFSSMFDRYTTSHGISAFVNQRIKIEDTDNPQNSQFAHFICRKEHERHIASIGGLLMDK